MIIITVQHEVPFDGGNRHPQNAKYCVEGGGGFMDGYTICPYKKNRDRTGKKGVPVQKGLPKCTLFNQWLKSDGCQILKCDECLEAIEVALAKEDD